MGYDWVEFKLLLKLVKDCRLWLNMCHNFHFYFIQLCIMVMKTKLFQSTNIFSRLLLQNASWWNRVWGWIIFNSFERVMRLHIPEMWGAHGSNYEEYCLLKCDAGYKFTYFLEKHLLYHDEWGNKVFWHSATFLADTQVSHVRRQHPSTNFLIISLTISFSQIAP
jgi:hypothetical protein